MGMIRNAVIHLTNEQPLLADLYEMPAAADQGLVCTNLRTMAGKRPVFVDHSESVFYFPYSHVRFVEVPPSSLGETDRAAAEPTAAEPAAGPTEAAESEAELELDEDFLRRIREV